MTEVIKTIEEVEEVEQIEEVEEVKTTGKYIPECELAESKRIMQGRIMYTINRDFEIVETATVRCNPSSYDYNALKLFLENNRELLESYFNSDNNYGIGFYACGYNGRDQQEFAQDWAENGVRVFQHHKSIKPYGGIEPSYGFKTLNILEGNTMKTLEKLFIKTEKLDYKPLVDKDFRKVSKKLFTNLLGKIVLIRLVAQRI